MLQKLLILFTCLLLIMSSHTGKAQNKNILFVGSLSYPEELSDIWGYVDSNGREYALVCTESGLSIVDLLNPFTPSEVKFIPGPRSIWRDVKEYNGYAYLVHDITKGGDTTVGLTIVDLRSLPAAVTVTLWTADTLNLQRAHNIWIDENGIAYIFGSNVGSRGGALMLDLKPDPIDPVVVGNYTTEYIHDGVVRRDTMWACEILKGQFSVVDVSNKDSLVLRATHTTYREETHSCDIRFDTLRKTLFVADETPGAYVLSYDVSDLDSIVELDRYQSTPGSGNYPHNVFVHNNYLVVSYYRDGIIILDATRPGNLVEVGRYDTAPLLLPGNTTDGAWGVYEKFPSGNIVVSDIQEGLVVLAPNYQRACYLEGKVTDTTGTPLSGITVEITKEGALDITDLNGYYAIGVADPGPYTLRLSNNSCFTMSVPVVLKRDTNFLDMKLGCCFIEGRITDIQNKPRPDAKVYVAQGGDTLQINKVLDETGAYQICNLVPGNYDLIFKDSLCFSKLYSNFMLIEGQLTFLNVKLICTPEVEDPTYFASPNLISSAAGEKPVIYYSLNSPVNSDSRIRIFDSIGRLYGSYNLLSSKGQVEIGLDLVRGMYFARLDHKKVTKSVRFVIQ